MSTLRGKENGVDSSGDPQRGERRESKRRAEPIGARNEENDEGKGKESSERRREAYGRYQLFTIYVQ